MKTLRILVITFFSLAVCLMAVSVFPDLSNAENFRKAQNLCDLNDYQSSRLYKLQYLFKILSDEIQHDLDVIVAEQALGKISLKTRISHHREIDVLHKELLVVMNAYQNDVKSLLTEEQYKTLFKVNDHVSHVLKFKRNEKVAYY
jgi:hypothetical protein